MHSCELPRATKINQFSEVSSAMITVEYRCFDIENLCDKSGKVVCIKSLLIDFILKL